MEYEKQAILAWVVCAKPGTAQLSFVLMQLN
jgi:hypothetical protein